MDDDGDKAGEAGEAARERSPHKDRTREMEADLEGLESHLEDAHKELQKRKDDAADPGKRPGD